MFGRHSLLTFLSAAFITAVLTPPTSVAEPSARDMQEINRYVLTEPALAKYKNVIGNLSALEEQMSELCDDDESSQSLDEDVARIEAIPGARAAISSAGMPTREYLIFTFSIFQNGVAAWALTQPGGTLPAGATMANVNFYNAHAAELRALGEKTGSGDCDGDDREEEEVEGAVEE